jgi:serine/threonine protein kinase
MNFVYPFRTTLALSDLEDAIYLEDWSDDHLSKRHGCPAYIAPEMLQPGSYSGRASDIWSAGIILYTLLVGHYPFFDTDPQVLFTKIRAGYYHLPPTISYIARHLISSLLAYDPSERPSADAIASHPWLIRPPSTMTNEEIVASLKHASDQIVPIHKMID